MREKVLQPEHNTALAKPKDATRPGQPVTQDLRAFLTYAQGAYGNRAVGHLLQTLTNTGCACSSSAGGAGQCEECRNKTLQTDPVSIATSSPATHSIMSDGDTETLALRDGRSSSISGGVAEATNTIDGLSDCSVSGAFSNIPNNVSLVASLTGSRLHRAFSMIGTFSPSIPCKGSII